MSKARIRDEYVDREAEVHEYIEKYSELFGLDPNLIRAVITQESRFIAEATSPTGAYGYGQFTTIGAKQVQNIAAMTDKAADLADFTKYQADEPDHGVKAMCATFWWLMYKKYRSVTDKKVQLEAALTFYNSGGRPAALVVKYGGHAEAVEHIKALPTRYQSQSVKYAPECAMWFIAWYDYYAVLAPEPEKIPEPVVEKNPFDESGRSLDVRYRALIEALLLLAKEDEEVDSIVNSRDGLTELTLLFPGELK